MPINPDALGAKGAPVRRSWSSTDTLLYAVGVGAGLEELEYTTENTKDLAQRVLPTFAVIPGDELTISMWVSNDSAVFRTTNQHGDVVIDQGQFVFRKC
jgi:hypothetical protein